MELLSPSLQLPSPTVCGAPVRGARRAHQALVTVARNKQFLLQIASEEKRPPRRGPSCVWVFGEGADAQRQQLQRQQLGKAPTERLRELCYSEKHS